MRRFLFCLLWFVLFAFVALMVSGMVVALNGCPETGEFSVGYDCGKMVAEQFMGKYRPSMVVGSVLLSIAGTVAGICPGQRSDRSAYHC